MYLQSSGGKKHILARQPPLLRFNLEMKTVSYNLPNSLILIACIELKLLQSKMAQFRMFKSICEVKTYNYSVVQYSLPTPRAFTKNTLFGPFVQRFSGWIYMGQTSSHLLKTLT